MQLAIHGDWIRPLPRIHIHLAHLRVIEPIDHNHVGREVTFTVTFRDGQNLFLRTVSLLALNESVGGFRQQVRNTGESAIAGIDFITGLTGNHKEGNAVADLRRPFRLLVKPRFDRRFRRIVPDQAITVIGDDERNARALATRSRVVVPALDGVAAMIEIPLLILTEAVIMFIVRRMERRAYLKDGRSVGRLS